MARISYVLAAGFLTVLAAATPASRAPILRPRQTNGTTKITFADIVPSSNLNWVDCYEANFQCTFLTVPLDYENTEAGTTDIAFIRYLISEDAEDLLYNPGEELSAASWCKRLLTLMQADLVNLVPNYF
jgi:hypothetical protein